MKAIETLSKMLSDLVKSEKQAIFANDLILTIHSHIASQDNYINKLKADAQGLTETDYVNNFDKMAYLLIAFGYGEEKIRYIKLDALKWMFKNEITGDYGKIKAINKMYEMYLFEKESEPIDIQTLRNYYKEINNK